MVLDDPRDAGTHYTLKGNGPWTIVTWRANATMGRDVCLIDAMTLHDAEEQLREYVKSQREVHPGHVAIAGTPPTCAFHGCAMEHSDGSWNCPKCG